MKNKYTNFTGICSLLAMIASVCLISSGVKAGEEAVAPAKNSVTAESPWESSLQVDGWLVDMNIGLEHTASGLSTSVFLGIDDILNNLDWIVPISGDFRYKQIGFMPSLVALKISGGQTSPGPLYNRANIELQMGVLDLPFYYRIVDQPKTSLDVLAGARLLWMDLDVKLTGGPLGAAAGPASAGTDVTIWDGIVGLRLEHNFNEKLYCSLYGDVGTGTSDLTWQFLGSIGYRVTENVSMITGYRYLGYELGDDDADVDITAKGIQVSLNWEF